MRHLFQLNYAAHTLMSEPARERSELWRLLFGLVLVAAVATLLGQLVFGTIYASLAPSRAEALFNEVQSGTTARGMLLFLLQFAFITAGVGFVCVALHKRSVTTLLGPLNHFSVHFVATTVTILLIYIVIVVMPPYGYGASLEPGLGIGRWLIILPLALAVVLIQSSAEEILFRGYIQQQLAARFTSPFVWMVLPSLLFAYGHYAPSITGDNAVIIAIWAGIFGLLMADLTARSGSLGPAVAVHFVNNVFALLITAFPDDMSGLALFHLPFALDDAENVRMWLPVDFGIMIVSWLAARVAIGR